MIEISGFDEPFIPQRDTVTTGEYQGALANLGGFLKKDVSRIEDFDGLVEAMGGDALGKALKTIIITNGQQEEIPYRVLGEQKDRTATGFKWDYSAPYPQNPLHILAEYFVPDKAVGEPKVRIFLLGDRISVRLPADNSLTLDNLITDHSNPMQNGTLGPDQANRGSETYFPTGRRNFDRREVQQGYAKQLQKVVKEMHTVTRPPTTQTPHL